MKSWDRGQWSSTNNRWSSILDRLFQNIKEEYEKIKIDRNNLRQEIEFLAARYQDQTRILREVRWEKKK